MKTALIVAVLLAAAPQLHAQAPGLTGTVIVTNKAPATATIVDAASGKTLATLPTGDGPHEVVMLADGRTAVITDYGTQTPGHTLTVIDVPALRVIRTVDLGNYRRPHGIVAMTTGSIVAVTSETERHLLLVDIATGSILQAIPTEQNGSHMVGVVRDGTRAWTGNIGSNTVSELNLVTGTSVRTIAVPAQPEAINVTPDGSEVWVGSNATGTVSVVSTSTAAVTPAATEFGWPYRVLFSADATQVLVPDYRNETLRFLDRATRAETDRMSFPGGGPQGIILTRDGRHVLLSLSRRAKVVIIEIASATVVGELAVGETPDGVAFTSLVVPAQP